MLILSIFPASQQDSPYSIASRGKALIPSGRNYIMLYATSIVECRLTIKSLSTSNCTSFKNLSDQPKHQKHAIDNSVGVGDVLHTIMNFQSHKITNKSLKYLEGCTSLLRRNQSTTLMATLRGSILPFTVRNSHYIIQCGQIVNA